MGLKPGLKQTEVGVIPENWEVCCLHSLVKLGPKNGYSGQSGSDPRGTATLSLSATSSGRIVLNGETTKYLLKPIPKDSPLFLQPGDVLVQRSNTAELVGTTAVFQGPEATFVYPDLMMRLRFKHPVVGEWFWRYANSHFGRTFFRGIAAGSTGTMPKISGDKLREMPIPVPPAPELEATTQALNDVDALIESVEQLLAKKRHLKQGAMQVLLTGRKRLRGFQSKGDYKQTEVGVIPEDWKPTRLGEIGEALIGLTYKPTDVRSDGILVLRSSNVQNSSLRFEDNVFVQMEVSERIMVRPGDILICVRNGSRDLIGKCAKIDERAAGMTFGAFMAVFRTAFHPFVYHQFQSDIIKKQIQEHLGATINQITNKSLNSFRIPLPPTEAEQAAVATVLSDMDAEIAALETKLTKARQLKTGMAQELLTGRIRLI